MMTESKGSLLAVRFKNLNNPFGSVTIPKWVPPIPLSNNHFFYALQNILRIETHNHVGANAHCFGPLRTDAKYDARHAQDTGLLLNTAGISQNKLRVFFQLEKLKKDRKSVV